MKSVKVQTSKSSNVKSWMTAREKGQVKCMIQQQRNKG